MNFFYRYCKRKAKSIQCKLFRDQVLINRVKLLKQYDIQNLLDVGANTGQFAYYTRKAGYNEKIISFEPLSSAYSLLTKFAAKDPLWDAENMALGDVDDKLEINIAGNLQSSSFLKMMPAHLKSAPESAYCGKERVTVHKLDTVIDRYAGDLERTFLKIDAQGYEKKVLQGAAGSIHSLKGIQVELSTVELYRGESLFYEMINYIHGKGFTLCSVEPGFYDAKTGQLLQLDAIFYRT
jgi:FkbM family methyltransferase